MLIWSYLVLILKQKDNIRWIIKLLLAYYTCILFVFKSEINKIKNLYLKNLNNVSELICISYVTCIFHSVARKITNFIQYVNCNTIKSNVTLPFVNEYQTNRQQGSTVTIFAYKYIYKYFLYMLNLVVPTDNYFKCIYGSKTIGMVDSGPRIPRWIRYFRIFRVLVTVIL